MCNVSQCSRPPSTDPSHKTILKGLTPQRKSRNFVLFVFLLKIFEIFLLRTLLHIAVKSVQVRKKNERINDGKRETNLGG